MTTETGNCMPRAFPCPLDASRAGTMRSRGTPPAHRSRPISRLPHVPVLVARPPAAACRTQRQPFHLGRAGRCAAGSPRRRRAVAATVARRRGAAAPGVARRRSSRAMGGWGVDPDRSVQRSRGQAETIPNKTASRTARTRSPAARLAHPRSPGCGAARAAAARTGHALPRRGAAETRGAASALERRQNRRLKKQRRQVSRLLAGAAAGPTRWVRTPAPALPGNRPGQGARPRSGRCRTPSRRQTVRAAAGC